jgi:hypothetical protein
MRIPILKCGGHGMQQVPLGHTPVTSMPAVALPLPLRCDRYSAPFREQVQSWVVKLSTVSEILEQWLMVQVGAVGGFKGAVRMA